MIPQCVKNKKLQNRVTELEKGEIYSEAERLIGKWTNGNNLYRKIFFIDLNNTTDGTWTNTVSEKICDNVNLRFIENAFINVNQARYNLPYYSNSGYGIKGFTNENGGITIAHNNSIYNNLTVVCSVLYTKTTD